MAVDFSDVGLRGLQIAAGIDLQKAQARNLNANAGQQEMANQRAQAEQALEQEAIKKLSEVAKGGRGSTGQDAVGYDGNDSAGAPLRQIGELMIQGGALSRGTELIKSSLEIQDKEEDILSTIESRNKTRLENIISTGNLFSNILGTAKNQSEWDYGIAQLEQHPGVVGILGEDNFAQLKNMPFDPNVAQFLTERAINAKDRAELEFKEMAENRAERNALSLANYRRDQTLIAEGNLRERRRAQDYKEKTDGRGATGAPTPADLKAAETSIANLIFDGKVPAEGDQTYVAFKAGAQEIASRARQLVRESKGLDFNAAITRATIQSKTNGDWLTMTADDERGFLAKMMGINEPEEIPNARFRGRGMKAVDAIQMPAAKAELQTGSYYVTPRGVAKWDGTNFVKDE